MSDIVGFFALGTGRSLLADRLVVLSGVAGTLRSVRFNSLPSTNLLGGFLTRRGGIPKMIRTNNCLESMMSQVRNTKFLLISIED